MRGAKNTQGYCSISIIKLDAAKFYRQSYMKGDCPEAKANYSLYEQLLLGAKSTEGMGIVVSELKPSNKKWLVHRLLVEQLTILGYRSELHTEVGLKQNGNFKFLLFASRFTKIPLANYDSRGITHRNSFLAVPLPEQQVTTPHFNRYNSQGQ